MTSQSNVDNENVVIMTLDDEIILFEKHIVDIIDKVDGTIVHFKTTGSMVVKDDEDYFVHELALGMRTSNHLNTDDKIKRALVNMYGLQPDVTSSEILRAIETKVLKQAMTCPHNFNTKKKADEKRKQKSGSRSVTTDT